jgi:transposase InsO family protein
LTRPANAGVVRGAITDIARSKNELVVENALLRQQLIVLRRQVARPHCTARDRLLLVLLARCARAWKEVLLIVQPNTLLRWHRAGFRLVWRMKSRGHRTPPTIAPETIALIRRMATENRLWGAERIRGELIKLGIQVSKRTIQKYMRGVRPPRRSGQTWATFVHNHGHTIWACDFIPITDLLFRPIYAFFIVELASRRVVHVGVTRHPTDAWAAQQLREATPEGQTPRHLICDNDSTFGPAFRRVAAVSGIDLVRTAYRAPRMNAICERFMSSVRRECLDHLVILHERQLRQVLREYVRYFNRERPHQGIGQAIPMRPGTPRRRREAGTCVAVPILGGLHHAYRRAA